METRFRLLFPVFAPIGMIGMTGMILAAGCGGRSTDAGPSDATVADAADYTDLCVPDSPCSLTDGTEASDFLAPVGDSDDWKITVPEAGRIMNIVVRNDVTFSPIRLQVVLFGPDNTAVAGPENSSGNGVQRVDLQVKARAAGVYTLTMREVGNDDQDRRNPYYVKVTLLSESDDNEPNDTSATATPLVAGQFKSGVIGIQGDEDWFKIDAPARALLHIEMVAPRRAGSPVRFRWELWGLGAGTRMAESNEPTDGAWPVENRAVGLEAGTYYLRVMDMEEGGPGADLERVYQLTVTLEDEPDENDRTLPNETEQTPTTIQAGTAVTGYIAATGDLDYYLIRVTGASPTTPKLITVEATMADVSDVDLSFTVYGTDRETEVCKARDGDRCRAMRFVKDGRASPGRIRTSHVVTAVGNYIVLVRDFQDKEFDTRTSYQLVVDLPTEPDGNENYLPDARESARTVGTTTGTTGASIVYQWVEGYISHANDVDWYRFDIPGPPNLSAVQNGDWLLEVTLEMGLDGPGGTPRSTPVELQAFMFGQTVDYGGHGKQCRPPDPANPDRELCQFDDAENPMTWRRGETSTGECFVVFRESTSLGPHYFRLSDLDRDDFDIGAYGRYRLQVRVNAGCPSTSSCAGRFTDPSGNDLCGRP